MRAVCRVGSWPLQAADMLYSVYDAVGECTQDFPFGETIHKTMGHVEVQVNYFAATPTTVLTPSMSMLKEIETFGACALWKLYR